VRVAIAEDSVLLREGLARLLDDAGALAMQAIVVRDESFDRIKLHTDFIKTAIFPGGCLPSVRALTAAAKSNGFSHAHEDDIGLHYGETLRRWRATLMDPGDDLDALGLDEQFVRLWEFYFSYGEAAFEERYVRDVQLLYTAPAWRPPALRTAPSAETGSPSRSRPPRWCSRPGSRAAGQQPHGSRVRLLRKVAAPSRSGSSRRS
jgi:cyclopropane-fatty-acyl-phospholipid synthase